VNALANKTDSNRVLEFIDEAAPEETADWPRFVFQRHVSIETCGRFGDVGPARAYEEIKEVHRLVRGTDLADGELVAALNEDASAALRVLDWPVWAAFEQRSLLHVLEEQHLCLAESYGLEREAAQHRESLASRLGGLRLFPFLLRRMAVTPAEFARAVQGARPLLQERPELVTWANWTRIAAQTPYPGVTPTDLPPEGRWFRPLLPYGTALDYNARLWDRNGRVTEDLALLDEARHHVFHVLIRRLYAERRYGKKPPVSALKSIYGATVEFDRDALVSIADSARDSDAAEFVSAARAMCRLSLDDCVTLAAYLKDHGDPHGAAREYQRWVDGARDRVKVSNNLEWLVGYYYDHGQKEKALALARGAAEVYSAGGLRTMAMLLERMGQLAEAEEYLRQISERYDHEGDLVEFLVRHRDDATCKRCRRSLEEVIARAFPEGPQPVHLNEFGAARPEGVTIGAPTGHGSGGVSLLVGDVIVGIDAVRVNGLRQMRIQNRLSTEPEVKIVYWRRGVATEARVGRVAFRYFPFAPEPPR
jgi:tetratricopeptide (TPR) repeat protein